MTESEKNPATEDCVTDGVDSGASPGLQLSIMVLDDDPEIGKLVARYLQKLDCEVRVYVSPARLLAEFRDKPADIVITDLYMPKIDGLEVLRTVKAQQFATEVIILTGRAEKEQAIQALKLGAFDFFEKPFRGNVLVETVKRTARYVAVLRERDRLAEQVSFLSEQEAKRWGIDAFVGASEAVRKVLHDVRLLQRAVNTPVLITGESGTGKELVARAIHFGGARSARPFIPVNCSAVPKDLAESSFFGHVRGAFTGAETSRKGWFELAHGGTLFLDEIGDMSLAMQTKLLRVLEDGVVTPVGGVASMTVDVRLVAATNRDLQAAMSSGTFRTDLYYRLATFSLAIPPLRERRDDVPLLVTYALGKLAGEMGLLQPSLSEAATAALAAYDYPGNVRELNNLIERALLESEGREITLDHLHFWKSPSPIVDQVPVPVAPSLPSESTSEGPLNLREVEILTIQRALRQADGNMSKAARLLGINRTKLYRRMPGVET